MAATVELTFPAELLKRGFWLYVWEVIPKPGDRPLYYVGRTGDSSSPNAQSPFIRMGQHFGTAKNSNMLRTHLFKRLALRPDCCHKFRLIAYGPVAPRATNMARHRPRRDRVAAIECALAEDMKQAGYDVMNTVRSRARVDPRLLHATRRAFGKHLPKLARFVACDRGVKR